MATVVQPPELTHKDTPPEKQHTGGTGFGNIVPSGDALKALQDPSQEATRTGIWVGLAAITMSFAAFTSALLVRQTTGSDWHHLAIPSIVFANTIVLIASSVTLEIARRRVAAYARNQISDRAVPLRWLVATLVLGLLFVAGQYAAWAKLRAEGLYLASNPNSSFFYVLTAVHALHVLGGLGGLLRVVAKLRNPVFSLRKSTMDATSYYWHFMGILWLYILFVMWIKL
jgi:cytochrome c oxidase subunit III